MWRFLLIFFILHFLLYPASNGYNSYFDKDESSIGGLRTPPKVTTELYYASWLLDVLALVLGLLISINFVLMLFVYSLVSRAYSHPSVRLKKMPVAGWLAAGIFQGYFTWLMVYMGLGDFNFAALAEPKVQYGALLSTFLLFGSYPMTQVYQHEEDRRRGDRTISLVLGVKGTFHFTAAFFTLSIALFLYFFYSYFSWSTALVFGLSLVPTLVVFSSWYLQVRKDPSEVDFDRAMRLNFVSSLCMNLFFAWLLVFR